MHSYANVRMTQTDRLRLINQHLLHRRPLAEMVIEAWISLRCVYKWLACWIQPQWCIYPVFAERPGGHSIRTALSWPRSCAFNAFNCARSHGCWQPPLHLGQGPVPFEPGAAAKSGTQTSRPALGTSSAGLPNSYLFQKAGSVPPGRQKLQGQERGGRAGGVHQPPPGVSDDNLVEGPINQIDTGHRRVCSSGRTTSRRSLCRPFGTCVRPAKPPTRPTSRSNPRGRTALPNPSTPGSGMSS